MKGGKSPDWLTHFQEQGKNAMRTRWEKGKERGGKKCFLPHVQDDRDELDGGKP